GVCSSPYTMPSARPTVIPQVIVLLLFAGVLGVVFAPSDACAQAMWDFTAFPEGIVTKQQVEGPRSVWSQPTFGPDPRLQRPISMSGGTMALSPTGDGVLYQ